MAKPIDSSEVLQEMMEHMVLLQFLSKKQGVPPEEAYRAFLVYSEQVSIKVIHYLKAQYNISEDEIMLRAEEAHNSILNFIKGLRHEDTKIQ